MTVRELCPKAQRKADSPALFCGDGSYCAHQYYCPATRRYENTGWRECKRLEPPAVRAGERKENANGTKKTDKRRRRKS